LSAAARNWSGYERFFLRASLEQNVLDEMYKRWMLQLDAPDHTRLRALTGRAFTPRTVATMRQTVIDVADQMLNKADVNGGRFDAVKDFANLLPTVIIGRMLGVPEADVPRVHLWSTQLLPSFSPAMSLPALKSVNQALAEFRAFFVDLVERRRSQPADDLLSNLIAARDNDDKLSDEELFATAILLTFAGHATTTQAMGNLFHTLATRPDVTAELRQNPELIAAAVEESLRHESPLQLIYRTTLQPYTVDGVTIPRGEMVFLLLPAANRDPARFAEPDTFDLHRADNKHLAFGYGHHFCAGAGLARLEAGIAVERVLAKFKTIELDGPPPRRESSLLLRGRTSLPMRLTRPA
jgi:cytochrome P450